MNKYTQYIIIILLVYVFRTFFINNTNLFEGLTDLKRQTNKIIPYPENALINFNDLNSSEYSRTVNLPINESVSCKNFCGPKSQCSITREQCTSDIDCKGCNPGRTNQSKCVTQEVKPYDASGKLGQNQGINYSPLTTGFNNHNIDFAQLYEDSANAQINKYYEGVDMWTDSFNDGLELYNKKRNTADKYNQYLLNNGELNMDINNDLEAKYPMRISATGLFYETTPPASNSQLK